ncbi:hypothetical protein BDV95DRAFT_585743 [Massariosphaeria phaeospora]|uniref:Uncharacterized protein n=1 Tax=Massariosphaeria phaeospora TaxID=100035 RepID=A0A7C8M266_9PLEO|nr:hypothetical protein BDV95DRAFT_585743 [Massariosphaeria phaeospora]
MPLRLPTRTLLAFKPTPPTTTTRATFPLPTRSMASTTDKSHATGSSVVPDKAQEKLPKGVETSVPNAVHDTGDQRWKTHAKDGGEDSIVPKPVQKVVPEAVERALPNSIHNTGDSKK